MVTSFSYQFLYILFHHLGLNVYSILKHTKLVLTIRALNKIEKKLLHALHSYDTQKDQPSPPDEP
jgi:ribosomal protein L4